MDNGEGYLNWRHLGTYLCLFESVVPINNKATLLESYIGNLEKLSDGKGKINL